MMAKGKGRGKEATHRGKGGKTRLLGKGPLVERLSRVGVAYL